MRQDDRLRILVFGAGAIGTYVGGSLALRGNFAVFVERSEVAARIEGAGLRIRTADGAIRPVPLSAYRIAASSREAMDSGPFDLAVVALKAFDVPSLIVTAEPVLRQAGALPILCLCNGVESEGVLEQAFGRDRVVAGTVTTAVSRSGAGDAAVEKLRGTGVAGGHPIAERLARAMNDAGLNTRLYSRAADMKWSKLLTNLLGNATSAILDMPPAEVFADRRLYGLEVEQIREALRVMRAAKIRVVDLPGTPVRLLALGASLPSMISRPFLARAVGGGRGGKMPSLHIDLHAGRGESEVDHLHGAVARAAEKTGIPAPVNRLLTETLLRLTRREIAIDTFARKPEKLIAALADRPQ